MKKRTSPLQPALRRRDVIAGAAGCAALPLAACAPGGGVASVRFKVVARARLAGDEYEGFAVNELRARYTPRTLLGFRMSRKLKMEATVVDFGGKADALFVLLTDYLPAILTLWDIPGPGSADETTIPRLKEANGVREIPRMVRGRPDLKYPYYPRIAAFRDEADPTSVYQVDPDDLARTHGASARFLGLSIEIVDRKTPLTNEIQQRLPWLDLDSNRALIQPAAYWTDESAELGQRIIPRSFKSRN